MSGIYANIGGILMEMLPYIAYMDPMGYSYYGHNYCEGETCSMSFFGGWWQELDDEFMVVWDGYPVPQSASGQSLMCREYPQNQP